MKAIFSYCMKFFYGPTTRGPPGAWTAWTPGFYATALADQFASERRPIQWRRGCDCCVHGSTLSAALFVVTAVALYNTVEELAWSGAQGRLCGCLLEQLGVKPTTSWSQIRLPNYIVTLLKWEGQVINCKDNNSVTANKSKIQIMRWINACNTCATSFLTTKSPSVFSIISSCHMY